MPKYVIYWDCGYGQDEDGPYEFDSRDEAIEEAYRCWREAAEMNAYYGAKECKESDKDKD